MAEGDISNSSVKRKNGDDDDGNDVTIHSSRSHSTLHADDNDLHGSYLSNNYDDTDNSYATEATEHSYFDTPTSAQRHYAPNNSPASENSNNIQNYFHQTQQTSFEIHSPLHSNNNCSDNDSIDELWVICSPRSQERFVQSMAQCERRFVRTMQLGFVKYLWPCRQMLDNTQFRAVFQNMEKVSRHNHASNPLPQHGVFTLAL